MGKNLIQQRRGRGTNTYRSPSFRFLGAVQHLNGGGSNGEGKGIVTDIVHCAGHTAPLLQVALNGQQQLAFAPEGMVVGAEIEIGPAAEVKAGNVLPLSAIPEGTMIHNLELHPGDGGRAVRSSGTFARVVAKTEQGVLVKLPSRKERLFSPACRAAVGLVAGSGRLEKPFLKAGTMYHKMRARNKLYPRVCGISMNAVDHPFGGKGSHTKGRPTQSARGDPPGRKVGKIAPKRTGRRKV
ncbi:MAG: 50S ribosomal protein L2 [Nanoarchaeota archaeon]